MVKVLVVKESSGHLRQGTEVLVPRDEAERLIATGIVKQISETKMIIPEAVK